MGTIEHLPFPVAEPPTNDGTYDDGKTPFISSILDGIGMIPCTEQEQNNEGECLSQNPDSESSSGFKSALAVTAEDILNLLSKKSITGMEYNLITIKAPVGYFWSPHLESKLMTSES